MTLLFCFFTAHSQTIENPVQITFGKITFTSEAVSNTYYTFFVAPADTIVRVLCENKAFFELSEGGQQINGNEAWLKVTDTLLIRWKVGSIATEAALDGVSFGSGHSSLNPVILDTLTKNVNINFDEDSICLLRLKTRSNRLPVVLSSTNPDVELFKDLTNTPYKKISANNGEVGFLVPANDSVLVTLKAPANSSLTLQLHQVYDSVYAMADVNEFPVSDEFSIVCYNSTINKELEIAHLSDGGLQNTVYNGYYSLSGELKQTNRNPVYWINTTGNTFTWTAEKVQFPYPGSSLSYPDTLSTPGCHNLLFEKMYQNEKHSKYYVYEVQSDCKLFIYGDKSISGTETVRETVHKKGDWVNFQFIPENAKDTVNIEIVETPFTEAEKEILKLLPDTLRLPARDTSVKLPENPKVVLVVESDRDIKMVGDVIAKDGKRVYYYNYYEISDYLYRDIGAGGSYTLDIPNPALRDLTLQLSFISSELLQPVKLKYGENYITIPDDTLTYSFTYPVTEAGDYYYRYTIGNFIQEGFLAANKNEDLTFTLNFLIPGQYCINFGRQSDSVAVFDAHEGKNKIGFDPEALYNRKVYFRYTASQSGYLALSEDAMIYDSGLKPYMEFSPSATFNHFVEGFWPRIVKDSTYFIAFKSYKSTFLSKNFYLYSSTGSGFDYKNPIITKPGEQIVKDYSIDEDGFVLPPDKYTYYKYTAPQDGYMTLLGTIYGLVFNEQFVRQSSIHSTFDKIFKCNTGESYYILILPRYVIDSSWELQFTTMPNPDISGKLFTLGENDFPVGSRAIERYCVAGQDGYMYVDSAYGTTYGLVGAYRTYGGGNLLKVSEGDTVILRYSRDDLDENSKYTINFTPAKDIPYAAISTSLTNDSTETGTTVRFVSKAIDALHYRWDFNGDGTDDYWGINDVYGYVKSYVYNEPGNYTVRLITENCSGADTAFATITVIAPCNYYNFDLGTDLTLNYSEPATLTAVEGAVWSTGFTGRELNLQNYTETDSKETIWATYQNEGCLITDTIVVTYLSETSVLVKKDHSNITVYPTVVNNQFVVDAGIDKIKYISIINMQGITVMQKEGCSAKETIILSGITEGNYIVAVQTNNEMKYLKILKR